MNAAGQVLIEYVLLMVLFLLLIGKIAVKIPDTFSKSSPYLGGKIEMRIETGSGYAQLRPSFWQPPASTRGGVSDQ